MLAFAILFCGLHVTYYIINVVFGTIGTALLLNVALILRLVYSLLRHHVPLVLLHHIRWDSTRDVALFEGLIDTFIEQDSYFLSCFCV